MKKLSGAYTIFNTAFFLILLCGCTKKESATTPVLSTSPISNIAATLASGGGNITSDGGASITERGVCWSTSANPTIPSNTKTSDGTGIGVFTSSITGLSANTLYHVRSYATNSAGTAYGSDITFNTTVAIVIPTMTTTVASLITQTTASSGGNVTSDGGGSITARGVCWAITTGPTITLSTKTSDGTGTGTFVSSISGLSAGTIYYIRAYATNSAGTAYGNEISINTPAAATTVTDNDGNVYKTVIIGTQVWMAENLKTTKFNDNSNIPNITDRSSWVSLVTPGYCWYNNAAAAKDIVGGLYNWYTVKTGKLCPSGWHVPTDSEWETLSVYLGGASVAGGKLKETGTTNWLTPNTGTTNESGFTALPGGKIDDMGFFYNLGAEGYWWSFSDEGGGNAWGRYLSYNYSSFERIDYAYRLGFSIRCVKN